MAEDRAQTEDRIPGVFLEAEAMDGSSADSLQISVIGLVVVGCGLVEVAGDRRVDGAGIVTGSSEGTEDSPVVATGAFDRDHLVAELVGGDRAGGAKPRPRFRRENTEEVLSL